MNAVPLYLALVAQGLTLTAVEDPTRAGGYALRAQGLPRLDPDQRERARRQIRANRDQLLALLLSGAPDALAVRAEGHDLGDRQSREEAA